MFTNYEETQYFGKLCEPILGWDESKPLIEKVMGLEDTLDDLEFRVLMILSLAPRRFGYAVSVEDMTRLIGVNHVRLRSCVDGMKLKTGHLGLRVFGNDLFVGVEFRT